MEGQGLRRSGISKSAIAHIPDRFGAKKLVYEVTETQMRYGGQWKTMETSTFSCGKRWWSIYIYNMFQNMVMSFNFTLRRHVWLPESMTCDNLGIWPRSCCFLTWQRNKVWTSPEVRWYFNVSQWVRPNPKHPRLRVGKYGMVWKSSRTTCGFRVIAPFKGPVVLDGFGVT